MPIEIGEQSNIQDQTVLHGTHNLAGVRVGDRVSVGHGCILHGCEIGDETLIGMGTIILDKVKVPEGCFVGAGSLLTPNSDLRSGHLMLGRPAQVVRPLKDKEKQFLTVSAQNYLTYKSWYNPLEEPGS